MCVCVCVCVCVGCGAIAQLVRVMLWGDTSGTLKSCKFKAQ